MINAGFQVRVLKQLPIVAHLHTSWSLPPEICEEIASMVHLIVTNYVSYWFQAISPNEDFAKDVKLLLADLLSAVITRVLEIDPSQALTLVAKSLELLRLHLGWFREAYAQLADEYPDVFEGDDVESNLLKRQEYVAEYVQKSSFIHPGCMRDVVTSVCPLTPSGNSTGKKNSGDNAEVAYLRHVATQLLTQLNPQLGQQQDTNVFVSIAMNLLREIVGFKILKPLSEYADPRYVNELVLSCLQTFVDDKKDAAESALPRMSSSGNVVGMVPTRTLNKLRSTSSILYKASRRSGEHAEAAFQAVVEAMASAAVGAAEMVMEGDGGWSDPGNNPFVFGGAVFAANSSGFTSDRKAVPSVFATDDRFNVAKAAKMMSPLGLISGGLLSHKMAADNNRISVHMDDLKNAKTNIGCSLNSSIGKVKKRFQTFGNYQTDPLSTPPLSAGAGAAARMLRKQGQLLQKAWKRGESGASSPNFLLDGDAVTPSDRTQNRRSFCTTSMLNTLVSPLRDDEETASRTVSGIITMETVRDLVVRYLVKAVANYTKMYDECPKMHNSARTRELYDFLSALENVFMLGFRNNDSEDEGNSKVSSTPPLSPSIRRRVSVASTEDELTSRRSSMDTDRCPIYLDLDEDDSQYYWAYLAQDRPNAELLNTHWRFVASQCPTCMPSESFVSTRGVQWMLAALVKGSLGTLCAELFAHSDVTELFYESFALLLDRTLADSVLEALSQLDNLKVCLELSPLLGFHSNSDHEFSESSPDEWWLRHMASSHAVVSVVERAWEIERYNSMNGWVKVTDKRWQELPSSEWIWDNEWTLEKAVNGLGESSDSDATDSMWEYARNAEDTYHKKGTKFDSVRRRRWIRRRCQLPPVLVLPSLPVSPSKYGVSSPPASTVIADGKGKERKLKQRFNALSREKKNDKGLIATKSKLLLKSRPKHVEKEMPDSPMSDSTPGLTDSDELQQMSTKTSTFMKARASIPSLRRGTANKRMKSLSCDFESLSAKSSINGDPGSLYDKGENDDDNLCVRCFKALPSSNLGVGTCHCCHQRVCAMCLDFYAFMTYPPPLETSQKARVCGNCYDRLVSTHKLRIEAHVGEYLIKERKREIPDISWSKSADYSTNTSHSALSSTGDSSILDSAASRQTTSHLRPSVSRTNIARFEVTVKVKGAYAWSVIKTYHDFEMLEKQLIDKLKKQEKRCGVGYQVYHLKGVDFKEMAYIKSSLKTVAVSNLTYEQQLHILEQFLQQLLACETLCQSSVVQKFLLLADAYGTSFASSNPSMPKWEAAGETPTSPFVSSSISGVSSAEGVLAENNKWQKGRWVASDASVANSKETKMRVLQKIEVSLFAVLSEAFEFDGISMVRRQIFSMTRSFIKAFLGASHFRMLERQLLSFTNPKKLSGWIRDLQQYILSDTSDANVAPPRAPDMQVLRKDCLEAILASVPSKALSLFGDTACENAALKLHEFLQHEIFVKNLLFSISDELLLHLFPDSTPFKNVSQETTTPSATSASPSSVQVASTIAQAAIPTFINNDASDLLLSPISTPTSPLGFMLRRNSRSSTKPKE